MSPAILYNTFISDEEAFTVTRTQIFSEDTFSCYNTISSFPVLQEIGPHIILTLTFYAAWRKL